MEFGTLEGYMGPGRCSKFRKCMLEKLEEAHTGKTIFTDEESSEQMITLLQGKP